MSKPNLITPHDIDRLGELREQQKDNLRNQTAIISVILRSGKDEVTGEKFRAVVVERSFERPEIAALQETWLGRWLLRKYAKQVKQKEVRTYETKTDESSNQSQ